MNIFLIFIGKLVLLISKVFNLGSGSTWPGHIAMETNPRFLKQILNKNKHLKIILVAGTNGKTTTSLMLQKILEKGDLAVFRNEAGANLLNGMASSIIKNSNLQGKINHDIAIFEVDENNLKLILHEINPYVVLILNIFRDQLDRYGEVNKIATDWKTAIKNTSRNTQLVVNGDDPTLTHIATESGLSSLYFGIHDSQMKQKETGYDTDFTYCPECDTKLTYSKISFSHMGNFSCKKCGFKKHKTKIIDNLHYPLFGQYNVYNTNAAALVANSIFNISTETINTALEEFKPAFGRQEEIFYKGKKIIMLLSKNPAGFNQSIDAINSLNKKQRILLLLNDRVPDGRDVSWIWDVDFEKLPTTKINIAGDRGYDMGVRIQYAGFKHVEVFDELSAAIEESTKQTKIDETLFILPTYSAMLATREIMTGKKIL